MDRCKLQQKRETEIVKLNLSEANYTASSTCANIIAVEFNKIKHELRVSYGIALVINPMLHSSFSYPDR